MKVLLNVVLGKLEENINRQILVDEIISLEDLCEYVIISMNGKEIPLYELSYGDTVYYLYLFDDYMDRKSMQDLTLKDLKLKKKDDFYIEYNFDNFYYFRVFVEEFIEEDKNNKDISFKVLSGKGYGLLDNITLHDLDFILNKQRNDQYCKKSIKDFLGKTFDLNEVNEKVIEYKEYKQIQQSPKYYIFNVSLEGLNTQIKRKILINNNLPLSELCEIVIKSMNGDLSHSYAVKKEKDYLNDCYLEMELYYLNLKEKQRFEIIYDFGDNWKFNITLSKIIDGYDEDYFKVLSGKGYGIIEDCGGVWELYNIFNGENNDWGNYDINDFDLKKCNEQVEK